MKRGIFFVLLFSALAAIYSPLIKEDAFVVEDDDRVVTPMREVRSISDYWAQEKAGQIADVQPIRDFSFWIDIQLERATSAKPFHATNLLVWFGVLLLLFSVTKKGSGSDGVAGLIVLLVAFHPATVNSVGWVAARKHLLSAFFILAATRQLLLSVQEKKMWKNWALVSVFFLLALFSHPIQILWPVWAACFVYFTLPKTEWRRYAGILTTAFLVSGACGVLNEIYYRGAYLDQNAGHAKYEAGLVHATLDSALALGRSFLSVMYPVSLKVFYYSPVDPLNYLGLGLLAVFLIAGIYGSGREGRLWILFAALPLLVVTLRLTNIFVSDTYLLTLIIGLACFGSALFPRFSKGRRSVMALRGGAAAVLALVILAVFGTQRQAAMWRSTRAFCDQLYKVAPNPQNMTCHGMYLIDDGRSDEALSVAAEISAVNPAYRGIPDLTSRAVYGSSWDLKTKIKYLETHYQPSARFSYYLGLLRAQNGDFGGAYDEMTKPMVNVDEYVSEMRGMLETSSAEFYFVCVKSKHGDCQEQVGRIRQSRMFKTWNDEMYRRRLSSLGL